MIRCCLRAFSQHPAMLSPRQSQWFKGRIITLNNSLRCFVPGLSLSRKQLQMIVFFGRLIPEILLRNSHQKACHQYQLCKAKGFKKYYYIEMLNDQVHKSGF